MAGGAKTFAISFLTERAELPMGNVVTVESNHLLDASLGTTAYTAPTGTVKLALITNVTASTATTAGSEVSGGSYARQAITFASSTSGTATTNAAINFTGMPGSITIAGIEIWDSNGTPVRRWFGVLGSSGSPVTKTVNPGDTVSFASGAISITLS